ncbi:uncharacterized protein LOC103711052 [Phoenix dactylifera]|uniref:Uncharacterized protein LOC103711052 n=1 Tax=Phoenix dactylifera TaxID=42345 RepID=A0A8B7CAK4_PHODC|nr:uncharacterized protein LOC103711052 [Phoenix dactylifera]
MEKSSRVVALLLVLVVVAAAAAVVPTDAKMSPAACQAERRAAINACKAVVYGQLPSPQCCQRARVTHVECVCSIVTPKLAALVNVNRAIRLIEGCGRRVPRHFKCGSIITP